MRAFAEGWAPGWRARCEDYESAGYAVGGCGCLWKKGVEGCGRYLVGTIRVGLLGCAVIPGPVGALADEGVGIRVIRKNKEDLSAGGRGGGYR